MNKTNKTTHENKIIQGVATALALIIASGFLYLYPEFLGVELLSYIVGAMIGIIGILGLLTEIGKLDDRFTTAFKHITTSIFLGLILFIVYSFLSNPFVNTFIFLLSIVCIYGFILGLLEIMVILLSENNTRKSFVKFLMFILNLLIFILTVLQIIQVAGQLK